MGVCWGLPGQLEERHVALGQHVHPNVRWLLADEYFLYYLRNFSVILKTFITKKTRALSADEDSHCGYRCGEQGPAPWAGPEGGLLVSVCDKEPGRTRRK